jgi:hypothetical protein
MVDGAQLVPHCDVCGEPAIRHFGRLMGITVSPWGSGQAEVRLCEHHVALVIDFLCGQRKSSQPPWPEMLELSRWAVECAHCDLCGRQFLGRAVRTQLVPEWTAIVSCPSCASPECLKVLAQLEAAATISSVVMFTREEAVTRLRAAKAQAPAQVSP